MKNIFRKRGLSVVFAVMMVVIILGTSACSSRFTSVPSDYQGKYHYGNNDYMSIIISAKSAVFKNFYFTYAVPIPTGIVTVSANANGTYSLVDGNSNGSSATLHYSIYVSGAFRNIPLYGTISGKNFTSYGYTYKKV
jgi:hypothetical protein